MSEPNGSGENTESTETETEAETETTAPADRNNATDGTKSDSDCPDDHETNEETMLSETKFEVLNIGGDEESASVTFDDETIIVTGAIRGNNGCYTAQLTDVRLETDRLIVSVESYEDAEEDQDCTMAVIYIEYETTVEIDGDRPESVRVEHNDEHMTTVHAS